MLEKFFKIPGVLARHKDAPYAEERERYLAHCVQQGYTRVSLRKIVPCLLRVARAMSAYPDLRMSSEQIEAVAKSWGYRRRCSGHQIKEFIQLAKRWLRFIGCLDEPVAEPTPFADLIKDFSTWLEHERGLMSSTIQLQSRDVTGFLCWYGTLGRPLAMVEVSDVDSFLANCGRERWCRLTVATCATALRSFFRYAATRGWCRPSIADAIQAPRIYPEEGLPLGPS